MKGCDHKFIDSVVCLKCGVHVDELRRQDAIDRAALEQHAPSPDYRIAEVTKSDAVTVTPGARFSPCRRYRYTLTRSWSDDPRAVVFCGLNPSTADETHDDPTIRREIAFAKAWGYGGLIKVNAYAFRSTDPKGLWRVDDPVGPDNLHEILCAATWFMTDMFVAAWGTNIRSEHQDYLMRRLRANGVKVHALRLTKHGYPSHPLYLPQALRPFEWSEVTP